MLNRLATKPQRLAIVLVIFSVLGAFSWLWWSATKRPDVNFLPTLAGADWIVYPKAPAGGTYPRLELATRYRRTFVLDAIPANAELKVRGFHDFLINLNGKILGTPSRSEGRWKEPDSFPVSNFLRPGTNELWATVLNSNGPPALWLLLHAGNFVLKSDETWEASYADAAWKSARIAKRPVAINPGNPLYGGEEPATAFRKRWSLLLLFAAFSACVLFAIARGQRMQLKGRADQLRQYLPIIVLATLWSVLFANNLPVLPNSAGYDVSGHRDYIDYVQTRGSLPVAGEGWEMFQPPLYYVICAGVLKLLSLSVRSFGGVIALRIFGLFTGIAHFILVWKSLRLLFPEERAKQNWGLLIAACLPPLIFLSHYVSNEGFAAALVSGSVYLTLRILKSEVPSWKIFTGLGLCLGAALLAKSTAVLALPPIFGALLWKALRRRAEGQNSQGADFRGWTFELGHICLVLVICVLVGGWHYFRTWHHYGTPIIGVWDTRTGFSWWQDEGFRNLPFYLRFGLALSRPWFSALGSFGDGLYSTLWGDGLLGGSASLQGPPWNYDFMALGYWLALVPTVALIIGAFIAIRDFIRKPGPEWFLILAFAFLVAWALVHMSVTIPYYCVVKAFYGLPALIPFCAVGAFGLDCMTRPSVQRAETDKSPIITLALRRFGTLLCSVLMGVWVLTTFVSFWVVHSSVPTILARARSLAREGHSLEAQQFIERELTSGREEPALRAESAKLLVESANETQAAQEAAIALRADPNDPANLTTLTTASAAQNPDLAIDYARRAIISAPGYALAYQQLAVLLLFKESFDEAERVSRQGLGLEPFNATIRQTLGEILIHRGQLVDGITQLRLACQLSPANVWARSLLAGALEMQHQTSEAIAEYGEVLRLQPNLATALNDLAWIRATSPNEQFRDGYEAVRLAEQACLVTGYKETQIIETLAAAYAEAGRFEEAFKTAARARDLARTSGREDLIKKNEELMKLFATRQPYRQSRE